MDPIKAFAANSDEAWQIVQSLFCNRLRRADGSGLGNSASTCFCRSRTTTLFFRWCCEELRFVGAVLVIVLFALLVWRGITIGMKAPDKFGSMLAIEAYHSGGHSGVYEHGGGNKHNPQYRYQPSLFQLRRHLACYAARTDGGCAVGFKAYRGRRMTAQGGLRCAY